MGENSKDNQASKSDIKARIKRGSDKVDEKIGFESKEEEIVSKNDLTKELLKNIVSTLDPKEATKLLEKTSMMSKEEKMSISKLKSLMNVDSEESDEEDMPIT